MRESESMHILRTNAGRTGWLESRSGRLPAQNMEQPRPRLGRAAVAWSGTKSVRRALLTMSTDLTSDWAVHRQDWLYSVWFLEFPVFARAGMRFESHLGGSGLCYFFIVVHGVGYMTGSGCESLRYFAAQRTFTMWTGSDGVQPASQSVLACSRARTRGCAL